MFDDYEAPAGVYDEAFEAPRRPRPHYSELLDALADADLDALAAELKRRLRERGVRFGASEDGLLALDLVPRLITAAEWKQIRAGIVQRARALDAFAADVYGERAAVAAGIVPERVIEGSEHREPAMRGAEPPSTWVSVVGFDLVRGQDGRFVVLEDQIRMPSGTAYAVAAREALAEVLPLAPPQAPCVEVFDVLGEALRAAAPADVEEPSIAILSAGPESAGWYEHERIGRELGLPVVTRERLATKGDELRVSLDGGWRAVDVIYQRTDEDRFTDADGRPTAIGELLLAPCRAGRLGCVNAPGAGIGDDKLVHAYVEDLIRFYLDEEPLLPSVETFDLGVAKMRRRALADRDALVFKPRGKMGGEGVVVYEQAGARERAAVERALERDPEQLIAQRRVQLSTHPTAIAGRLRPRRVDLRPYVIRAGAREWAMPGGLTRVALAEGSLIVNSSQGGGVKDSWVLPG